MSWTEEIFKTKKPIIAMCHLMALPGDPAFDKTGGMKQVIEWARRDLLALQDGGVDAVMFSNEFSLPYLTRVETITVAAMARIIGELHDEIRIPFGVNCLWDSIASLDLAVAVGAKFVREIFTGVYASDFGLWNTISPSVLSCPLDVHTGNVARKLELLTCKQNDSKAVSELDRNLRKMDNADPVKYDFALFGLSVFEKF